MRRVLNVGGNSKEIPLPPQYEGWEHVLLDIDPKGNPDIVCDARELLGLSGSAFDSIYCSHNLEHYYRHDAMKVLAGFAHILKPDGFAFIRVPDMKQVMRAVIQKNLDIDDTLYQSPSGPISVLDVIYGWGRQIEQSGNDFYAHKTGFTEKSLASLLQKVGFKWVFAGSGEISGISDPEIMAFAFLNKPSEYAAKLFGLPF